MQMHGDAPSLFHRSNKYFKDILLLIWIKVDDGPQSISRRFMNAEIKIIKNETEGKIPAPGVLGESRLQVPLLGEL